MSRRLAFIFRSLFSLALIAFVLRKVNWRQFSEILFRIDLTWAAAASSLTAVIVLSLALRWRIFLRAKEIRMSTGTIVILTWAGQFFNAVLPGSTGGDVVKIYHACRLNPERKADAAATVLVDRLTALVALFFLAGVGLAVNPFPFRLLERESLISIQSISWLAAVAAVLAIALWFLSRTAHGVFWGGRLRRTLLAVRSSFTLNGRWLTAFCLALVMHLLSVLSAYLFANALKIPMTFLEAMLMVPVVSIFIMVPITINGHGLRELLLIAYFSQLRAVTTDLSFTSVREAAVAFSLLVVANDIMWALPGGLLYMFKFRSSSQIESRHGELKPKPDWP